MGLGLRLGSRLGSRFGSSFGSCHSPALRCCPAQQSSVGLIPGDALGPYATCVSIIATLDKKIQFGAYTVAALSQAVLYAFAFLSIINLCPVLFSATGKRSVG